MHFEHVTRDGRCYRVCDPTWNDPSDTSYAKARGGRWNSPPGTTSNFGALYVNVTIDVALANARRHVAESFGVTLEDLVDAKLPDLQEYTLARTEFVDVISSAGVRAVRLPATFPVGVGHERCQRIARRAYAAGEHGIATRSAALVTGEEIAIFDRDVATTISAVGPRRRGIEWLP